MYKFICILLMLVLNIAAFSQKVYFVYLQSEADQPFIVKMNEKTFSSSPSGYIIVSKLKDSSYSLTVSFPQLKWTDQLFVVNIRSGDQGFLLKNFGEKGWGLFDLHTMGIQMASEKDAKGKALKTRFKEVSAFTEILSKAANDPSLKEMPVLKAIKKEETKTNILPALVKEETATSKEKQKSGTAITSAPSLKIKLNNATTRC